MATRTRNQFDVTRNVQKKVFQAGMHLVEADLNEQIDLALDRHRHVLSSLCNNSDRRFNDGFEVVGTGATLAATIKAGDAAFHLSPYRAVLLHLDADTTLSGFTSWVTSGARTDIIYIDIYEREVTVADDINLVNPSIGVETCTDYRITYQFKIAASATELPTPGVGHVFRELARITKNGTNDVVAADEITLKLSHFQGDALDTQEVPLWQPVAYSCDGIEPVDIESETLTFTSGGTHVTNVDLPVIKLPYIHNSCYHYLAIHCECYTSAYWAIKSLVTIGAVQNYDPPYMPEGAVVVAHSQTPLPYSAYLDLANAVAGKIYTIVIRLKVFGGDASLYMQRPIITAGLGAYPGQLPLNMGEM